MSTKRPPCPKCQSKKIVPIQFGTPSMEMYEKSKLGKFVLGGCCISGESAKWYCLDCEHEFGKYLVDIALLELPDPSIIKPLTLEFSIGGYSGPCHNVKLENEKLTYQHSNDGYCTNSSEVTFVIPTNRKWINFKKKLDIINVWGWDARYEDQRILDGTQWELEIDYGIKKISTSGSNSYPGANNVDMLLDWEDTPVFDDFLHALNLLLGGTKIQ